MSDPEPIDLSQLQNLNLAPDWVGDLQKRESAAGEVIWGRAPDHERESRGGGQGQGYGGGGGGRGPRREGGGFGQDRPRGPRSDDRGGRPSGPGGPGGFGGPPRGPRQDDRGPRPGGLGGPGGFGGPPRGPRQDDRGPRPGGPGGPRPDGPRGPRPDGPRQDRPPGDRPPGDRGPRPGGPRQEDHHGPPRGPGGPGGDRRSGPGPGPGGRPDFRRDERRGGPGRFDERPYVEPLPGWRVRLFAEPKSLEAIVRQVKASSRAYPVFEMGRLFLAGRDRYLVNFSRLSAPQPQRGPKGTPPPEAPAPPGGPDELFHIPTEGSLWTSRDEAIRHVLNGPVLQHLYRRETITVDPPKGIFTAVAVCGFSGAILGPPNHHSFQTTVARIHREQFYNLPLDRYKSRIRTEKDETLVAKWLEEQSTTVVFVPLTADEIAAAQVARDTAKAATEAAKSGTPGAAAAPESPASEATAEGDAGAPADNASVDPASEPGEPAAASEPSGEPAATEVPAEATGTSEAASETAADPAEASAADPAAGATAEAPAETSSIPVEPLKSQAAMEAHFIEHHAPQLIKAVTRISVSGNIPGKLLSPPLLALLRMEVEQQQRFPMQLVQDLCRDLEKENLKFFKRDKKATFVCRTRPHFIEDESHLSPRLRSIVGVVKANPGITVPKLVSVLAPHVEAPAAAKAPPAAKPEAPAAPEVAVPAAETEAEAPVTEIQAPLSPEVEGPAAETEAPTSPEAEAPVTEIQAPLSPEVEGPEAETQTPLSPEAEAPLGETTVPAEAVAAVKENTSGDAGLAEAPAATTDPSEAGTPAAAAPDDGPAKDARREEGRQRRQKGPKNPPAPPAPPAPLTSGEIGVLQDLRWLVQEGFVTEYASGELQILGRAPQPPAEKKPRPDKSAAPAAAVAAPAVDAQAGEIVTADFIGTDAGEAAAGVKAAAETAPGADAGPLPSDAVPAACEEAAVAEVQAEATPVASAPPEDES